MSISTLKNIVYGFVAVFIVFIAVWCSCDPACKISSIPKTIQTAKIIDTVNVEGRIEHILEIKGCYYITCGGAGSVLTHMGNCPNHKDDQK